jgi:hypothetical protein
VNTLFKGDATVILIRRVFFALNKNIQDSYREKFGHFVIGGNLAENLFFLLVILDSTVSMRAAVWVLID